MKEDFKMEVDLVLFNDFFGDDLEDDTIIEPGSEDDKLYESQKSALEAKMATREVKPVVEEVPEQEVIFVLDRAYKVGDIIQDGKYQYRAVKDAEWISAKEAAEIAEFADPSATSGWHVKAELVV